MRRCFPSPPPPTLTMRFLAHNFWSKELSIGNFVTFSKIKCRIRASLQILEISNLCHVTCPHYDVICCHWAFKLSYFIEYIMSYQSFKFQNRFCLDQFYRGREWKPPPQWCLRLKSSVPLRLNNVSPNPTFPGY